MWDGQPNKTRCEPKMSQEDFIALWEDRRLAEIERRAIQDAEGGFDTCALGYYVNPNC